MTFTDFVSQIYVTRKACRVSPERFIFPDVTLKGGKSESSSYAFESRKITF